MITAGKDTLIFKNRSINLSGRLMYFNVPRIMGILNVTPDSFYDGGKYNDPKSIEKRVCRMVDEGADIIDLGAYSSRPGSTPVSEDEELRRLRPAAEIIRSLFPDFPISLDTFRVNVAKEMINEYAASIVNDITAGEGDPNITDLIAEKRIPYIIMHMQGTPATMQNKPVYENVVNDILRYFAIKIAFLKSKGIIDIIIDPGFGFGKSTDHNYQLLKGLEAFSILEAPVLVGISRKGMIYKQLETDPAHSLNGTTALHMYALMKGANMLRVHDVKEAAETVKLFLKLTEPNNYIQNEY